jgi:alpha-L-fucosidase
MDTPFKRDIIKELCDSARRHDIKIDLYFSHPDWYDADFRPYGFHPLQTPGVARFPEDYGAPDYFQWVQNYQTWQVTERTAEETDRMIQRHRAQLVELLSHYGRIDMVCLDMWLGKDVWPQLRETVMLLRQLQPDVMLRIRGIGNYGDYYTPEGFVPGDKANTDMPWMVIYPLGRAFSYESAWRYHKGARWIIKNLIDCVAKGGNFMVGIGPDETGWFHPRAVKDLEEAGDWLRVNGEAIYATRPYEPWHEGEDIYYTRSKDGRTVYAICTRWPGRTLELAALPAREGLQVTLLGNEPPLTWRRTASGVEIDIPVGTRRPCRFAYAFKLYYQD